MKLRWQRRDDGAALVLAVSVLALLMLSLGGVLSISLARRQRIHRELSRDLAEMETRSVLLSLKTDLVTQIKATGTLDVIRWKPNANGLLLSLPDEGPAAYFESSVQGTAIPLMTASPSLRSELAPNAGGFLQGLACSPVASFGISGRWEPRRPLTNQRQPASAWQVSTSAIVRRVPLSAFTFYSSALETVAGASQGNLGRVYAEGDLKITSFVQAAAPIGLAGSLRIGPQAGILIQKGVPAENRAFGASTTPEDLQAQADGWIFERDSNPVLMIRPLTTAELFSKTPLACESKERQRLKPLCDLCIQHSIDASGTDIFFPAGPACANLQAGIGAVIQRTGNVLELDLAKLPSDTSWPSKIWIETDRPDITAVLVKNAQRLHGDLSVATGLHIQVSGSFNTEPPVRKASLMTMGRVTCVP